MDERRQAVPATTDRAVMTSSVMVVHALLEQLRCLSDAVSRVDQHITELTRTHADVEIFASLPGAGPVHTSRLISALGTDRSRYETVADLLTCVGIAPVMERSGRTTITHLRQSCHEFAGPSIRYSGWAKAYSTQQRTRGHSPQAAVRALAFQWGRMIFRCWKNHTPYKELVYLTALQKRGSSLLKLISEKPV
jgi:transposase